MATTKVRRQLDDLTAIESRTMLHIRSKQDKPIAPWRTRRFRQWHVAARRPARSASNAPKHFAMCTVCTTGGTFTSYTATPATWCRIVRGKVPPFPEHIHLSIAYLHAASLLAMQGLTCRWTRRDQHDRQRKHRLDIGKAFCSINRNFGQKKRLCVCI